MNIVMVEDERQISDTMSQYIAKYCMQYGVRANVDVFDNAVDFLKTPRRYDLVFMDIRLPTMDGMTAVRKLREKDADVLVIFVTSLAQYAINGYEVGAFDFIVKPVSYADFAMKFKRALKCLAVNTADNILITYATGKRQVSVDNITYVDIMKHEVHYHLSNGEVITCSGTLRAVAEKFKNYPFVMCNRCYLVNLRYVKEVRGDDVYVGNDVLQISKARRKDFIGRLNGYFGAGGKIK